MYFLSLQPPAKFLLPEVNIADYGKNCVVIDLDETLVHSSFKVTPLTCKSNSAPRYFKPATIIFSDSIKSRFPPKFHSLE